MRRPLSIFAACLAVATLTAGCSSDPKPSSSSEPATPTATTSPTELSEEDQAAADAAEAYRKWSRVYYSCLADPPSAELSCFDDVSVGIQVDMDQNSLLQYQEGGFRFVGEPRTVSIELVSVDLTNQVDSPADPDQGIPEQRTHPTVVFDVCRDMTGTDRVDAAGRSQRPDDYVWHRRSLVTVQNRSYPDPTGWRVWDAYGDAETEGCEP